MNFPVYPVIEFIRRLLALKAARFPADAEEHAYCKLFKNDVTPDANSTVSSFVEADFDGYNMVEVVMSAPSLNDQGVVTMGSGVLNFASTDGTEPQTVYGIWITNAGGDQLIAAQRFDTPQTMGGALPQAVRGVFRMTEPLTNLGWIDVE